MHNLVVGTKHHHTKQIHNVDILMYVNVSDANLLFYNSLLSNDENIKNITKTKVCFCNCFFNNKLVIVIYCNKTLWYQTIKLLKILQR